MRCSARYLLEWTLLALIDDETLTPRDLTDNYLRFLHRGVSTAATLIDIVIGLHASDLAGLPMRRSARAIPELPRKRCAQASMIRRVLDLLHRLDHVEASAARLARRFRRDATEAARIGHIAGLPRLKPRPVVRPLATAPAIPHPRALDLSG